MELQKQKEGGRDFFKEASQFHQDGKFEEAEKIYQMLLEQNHDNSGLLATYGTLCLQTRRYGLATMMLERALALDPTLYEAMSNLGLTYKYTGQTDKAFKWIEKATLHDDPSAEALANYAGLFTNTGNPEKAIAASEAAVKRNPELNIAHWNLALALLETGQWERGWKEHEWGLQSVKGKTIMRVDRKIGGLPYWDGTPNEPVLVYGEQGLGDEIMFASMIPDLLKTNPVILESHKRLTTLFSKSFGTPVYGTREDEEITWPYDHPELKWRISIGSLGKFYRNKKEDFPGTPYLTAEPALSPTKKKLRVGISWTGGQKKGRVLTRSVPLSWWRPILEAYQDVEFVSLQYTNCDDEVRHINLQGFPVDQYEAVKADDYYETAKLVMSCDLVISVCTSVIHLAGALGVPCWVMVPSKPAWRYGVKGPMPWYRSVRLYRQPADDWIPVIDLVAHNLRNLVAERSLKAA